MKIREQLQNPPDRLYHSTSVLVLGKPGAGKSRFGSTVGRTSFEEYCPLLNCDQDNGAGEQKFLNPALIPETFNDYKTTLKLIEQAVKYQDGPPYTLGLYGREWSFNGVIIDTLNRVQDVIRKGIKGGYLTDTRLRIQDYGSMLDDLLGLVLSLKELSESKPFHLVLTAQIAPDKITLKQSPNVKDSDELAASYYCMPSLAGSIAPKLAEHVDLVVTCYRDPESRKWHVYGEDTVTPLGVFAGKLRYRQYFKGNAGKLPDTWWDILKLYGVDVSNPASIGKLDKLTHVESHWSEDEGNRHKIEKLMTDNGIPIEALFKSHDIDSWEEMVKTDGAGQDAYKRAKAYWQEQTGQNGHSQPEDQPEPEPEAV